MEFFNESVFFGVFLSLLSYEIGIWCKKRWKIALFNPLLIAITLTLATLLVLDIPYETYNAGAKYISYLMTPATICLAIPLYEQFEVLKQNIKAIFAGIFSGVLTTMVSVLGLSIAFGLSHEEYITFLPKSITTAIGIGVCDELGGYVSITVAVIIVTGVFGNMIAEPVCRLLKITDPIAKGVGIGSASHAMGTAKAMEMGEIEGAMSGLSIAVSGILTVFMAILFSYFY